MNLILRREQRSSVLGKALFVLTVRGDLSAEEKANINKYKLGDTLLYTDTEIVGGSGLLGAASRLAYKAMRISVSVNDLVVGKKIECKDIVEMLAVEEQLKEAAQTFVQVLNAAASFGGEEVLAL